MGRVELEKEYTEAQGELINEFELNVSIAFFVANFLEDCSGFYEKYLLKCLGDIDIHVAKWAEDEHAWRRRTVDSKHPPKIKFPGLPKYAQSKKDQSYCIFQDNATKLVIKELTSFVGIPYADYFSVLLVWEVDQPAQSIPSCQIKIYLDVIWHKNTWLKSQVRANTRSELEEAGRAWARFASDWAACQPDDGGGGGLDLYVPLMLVFSLAQVFLLSMDVASLPCPRETLLGSALVAAVNAWAALGAFFGLAGHLLAGGRRRSSSSSLTRCSLSLPPAEVALAILGAPSALNLGELLARHCYRPSLPNTPAHTRLLAALPGAAMLLLAACTHYQALRYLHHDFLQDNKRLCALSSALDPADLVGVLTQKQLRAVLRGVATKGRR